MSLMTRRLPVKPTDAGARALEQSLTLAWQQLEVVRGFALQLALDDVGDIELPQETHTAADQAHLRSAAPLYLAMELENAQVIASVEVLSGLLISGAFQRDLGGASESLAQFWRKRNERFAPPERRAFFARLFGAEGESALVLPNSINQNFELLMIDLAETLYKYTPGMNAAGRVRAEYPLRSAAHRLVENILPRSGGLASFAARNMLEVTQEALDILKQPALQQALGARSVWTAVNQIAQQYLRRRVDVSSHLQRGHSGMVILVWLAEALPALADPNQALMSDDTRIEEVAATWLQASLNLAEQNTPAAAPVEVRGAV